MLTKIMNLTFMFFLEFTVWYTDSRRIFYQIRNAKKYFKISKLHPYKLQLTDFKTHHNGSDERDKLIYDINTCCRSSLVCNLSCRLLREPRNNQQSYLDGRQKLPTAASILSRQWHSKVFAGCFFLCVCARPHFLTDATVQRELNESRRIFIIVWGHKLKNLSPASNLNCFCFSGVNSSYRWHLDMCQDYREKKKCSQEWQTLFYMTLQAILKTVGLLDLRRIE